MAKIVNITFTDLQYKELVERAGSSTIQEYLINKEFPEEHYSKILNKILSEIQKMDVSSSFTLKNILKEDWEKIPNGLRMSLGKNFYKRVQNGEIYNVSFKEKDVNSTTWYQKVKE